jgi:hypothetical protein
MILMYAAWQHHFLSASQTCALDRSSKRSRTLAAAQTFLLCFVPR